MNLVRLGNKDILSRYNPRNFLDAARKVTKITANKKVASRQLLYGPRAIESVFGFSGIAGGTKDDPFDVDGNGVIDDVDRFSLAEFFGLNDPPVRISTLSSPALVVCRLKQSFGDDANFTEGIASKMLDSMKQELIHNYEAEHTSSIGFAMLWRSVTGTLKPSMQEVSNEMDDDLSRRSIIFLKDAKDYFSQYLQDDEFTISYDSFKVAYL